MYAIIIALLIQTPETKSCFVIANDRAPVEAKIISSAKNRVAVLESDGTINVYTSEEVHFTKLAALTKLLEYVDRGNAKTQLAYQETKSQIPEQTPSDYIWSYSIFDGLIYGKAIATHDEYTIIAPHKGKQPAVVLTHSLQPREKAIASYDANHQETTKIWQDRINHIKTAILAEFDIKAK